MKRKSIILAFLLFLSFSFSAFAQQNPKQILLQQACAAFDSGLAHGDLAELQKILHKHSSIGHSNGLIESKSDLLQHLQNAYLKYNSIADLGITEITLSKKLATVRRQIKVNGELQGKAFEVKLRVLETWIWANKRWQLFNRQAVKRD